VPDLGYDVPAIRRVDERELADEDGVEHLDGAGVECPEVNLGGAGG